MKKQEQKTEKTDSPRVVALPPFVYIGGLLLGLLLFYMQPLKFLADTITAPLGILLIVLSIVLIIWSIMSFIKANTNVDVRKPTTSIVTNGPYHFSRNPIYVAMTLFYLGIAVWVNDLWFFIALVPVLIIVQYGIIKREERYLENKFGDTYTQYKKSVRRWL